MCGIYLYSPLYGPVTTVDGAGHPTSAALITGRQGRRSIYRDRISMTRSMDLGIIRQTTSECFFVIKILCFFENVSGFFYFA